MNAYTAPAHQQLRRHRQAADIHQRHLAHTIGVSECALRRWELGHTTPRINHAVAYAATLNQQLTIMRGNQPISPLQQVLPNLARFRDRHHTTRLAMASHLHVTESAVGNTERKAAAGAPIVLATLERYFAALGYRIAVTPRQPERTPA